MTAPVAIAPSSTDAPEITNDALFEGALSIRQPARGTGYRVNVDALLLAAFTARTLDGDDGRERGRPARHAVDLGSGVGAVGLTLLHLGAARHVTMVEVDGFAAGLARDNAADNGWADRVEVVLGDARDTAEKLAGVADLVVCNPPYVGLGRGKIPHERIRTATYGDLETFVVAARRLAGRRARASFVYPATFAVTLLAMLRAQGLEPKRLRAVHGRAADKARVVLVECAAAKPGGLVIEPPFVETDGRGARSAALGALLSSPRAALPDQAPRKRSRAIAHAARTLR